jgi:hypothetical protein
VITDYKHKNKNSKNKLTFVFPNTCFLSPHSFLLYMDSLILSLLSCLFVSLSPSFSSTFIHLPFALNLSTSSLLYPFLRVFPLSVFFFFSLQHSVSILHSSLPPILSSIFAAVFPAFTLSLFLFHCSLYVP